MPNIQATADRFLAIYGDIEHKLDIYKIKGTFGPEAELLFTSKAQAEYLTIFEPDLLPEGGRSVGRLSSIFQKYYHIDPQFVHRYIQRVRRFTGGSSLPHPTADHEVQFVAVLGDLTHKLDVYNIVGAFDRSAEKYFENHHQAQYLRNYEPGHIPSGQSSDKSLGTAFEFAYYREPTFQFNYLRRLANTIARA